MKSQRQKLKLLQEKIKARTRKTAGRTTPLEPVTPTVIPTVAPIAERVTPKAAPKAAPKAVPQTVPEAPKRRTSCYRSNYGSS